MRETIEAFPGVFDDTADLLRHIKVWYAVEKGNDGLKYRVLDYDVAPQPPESKDQHGLWEQPRRYKRVRFRSPLTAVPKTDTAEGPRRYEALLGDPTYSPLPETPHQPPEEPRASAKRRKAQSRGKGTKRAAPENGAETVGACSTGCACRSTGEDRLQQHEQRLAARRVRRRGRTEMHQLDEEELDHIRLTGERWEYDADGDVIVNDAEDSVENGVLIAVDKTLLRSRLAWKDADLQETKRRSVVSEKPPEPVDRGGVAQARCRVAHGVTVVGLDRDPLFVTCGGEAIVDGGATHTFITEEKARELGILELVGDRRVRVKGVGAKMEWARGGNSVELLLRCR